MRPPAEPPPRTSRSIGLACLGEVLGPRQWLALALVVAGVALALRER